MHAMEHALLLLCGMKKKASLLLALGLLNLSALAACDGPDACDDTPYTSYCEGNVRWGCVAYNDGDDFNWIHEPCDGACVTVRDGLAICALDAEPDAFCPSDDWKRVCDGSTLNMCQYGYVEAAEDCGAPELCNAEVGRCVLDPEPHPACPEQGWTHVCDGDDNIECFDGYVVAAAPCGPNLCQVSSMNGAGWCVLDDEPDPRCVSLLEQGLDQSMICDGNTLVFCVNDLLRKTEDCGAKSCVHQAGRAYPGCR